VARAAPRRAAKKLIATFLPHMKDPLATAPLLHAGESTGRDAAALAYVHVACTGYLTLLHGGRCSHGIDNGLTEFAVSTPTWPPPTKGGQNTYRIFTGLFTTGPGYHQPSPQLNSCGRSWR
jgi:hypothetical protein